MFTRWGDLVYRFRFAVIGVVGAALLALGGFGFGLEDHLSSSGLDDPNSESSQAARISDGAWGRNHDSDIVVMYNAPEGKTIDDPEMSQKVIANLAGLTEKYPDSIDGLVGTYWRVGNSPSVPSTFGSKDKKHAFAAIRLKGDNDTETLRSYRATKDAFDVPGVDTEVSGLQGMAGTLNDTIANDTKRMELLAIPAVGVLLFFIFGGIVAAALPLIIGGLTILGANGIVMALTHFTEVNSFVTGVVSMIGLGLAIDYGLFIVSRFREEMAEGYDTRAAVRRSVMTAGRTVVFSATMIIASLGGILLFPQGFLRSIAYGTIATVSLAALTAITILPAMLAILGPRVDMLGLKRFRKDKTADEIENGFWGNMTRWVMKHPLKIAIPITIGLLLLIIPVKDLAFGGINEKYLPPDNSTRLALEHFYEVFPLKKTDPIELVFVGEDTNAIGAVWKQANQAPGLVGPFGVPSTAPNDRTIYRTSATLLDSDNADQTIDYLRAIETPDDIEVYVGGQPAIMKDSIDALLNRMPLMIALVLLVTTVLMFLTFGSLVLPIKAAVMSALGLGSTLGILTWIFIDGNGSGILNFTPQPISAPVLVLIIAIIYGLSTDYEVFLLSRMVEARAQGASTTEAVRIGTAQTGRIITAAALILLVVTGAFAFSDLVMMQYIAYGMIAALFIDATVLRMLLVPAIMKLLGDDCWWAPKWMKRIQEKIGLGEPILDDERPAHGGVVDLVKTTPITDPPTMQMTAVPDSKLARTPRRPRTVAEIEAEAPTQRIDKITEAEAGEPARPRLPMSPDPTRPRASMLSSGEPTRELPVVKPGTPAKSEDAAKQEDSGLDLPKYETGEPTQVLPIVKSSTPNPAQGRGDSPTSGDNDHGDSTTGTYGESTSETSADNDRGYSGPSFGTPPAGPTDLGDPETGPGGAARSTNGLARTNGAADSPSDNPGFTGPSFGDDARFGPSGTTTPDADRGDTETPSSPSVSRSNTVGDSGPGLDLPGIATDLPRRGSARVQPPTGYTPGVIGENPPTPRVSPPTATGDNTGFGAPTADSPQRPSIVPPARPSTATPPRGIVDPPTPSIVNPPPSAATPASRASDAPSSGATPTSGAFSGFSPVTASNLRPVAPNSPAPDSAEPTRASEQADAALREPDSRPHGAASPSTDLSAVPGAHRAESGSGTAARAETEPESPIEPHSVFGTSVPVEPQPSTPWNSGMTSPGTPRGFNTPDHENGPRFSPVTPSSPDGAGDRTRPAVDHPADFLSAPNPSGTQSDSTRSANIVRPQVAPPGFTEITRDTAAPATGPTGADETAVAGQEAADHGSSSDQTGADGQWQAPSGFTAVPNPPASPTDNSDDASTAPSTAETDGPAAESGEAQADTRNEIENWMAQLRSSRRGTAADEGRHHGGEGRTVSVNELLRRREDD
ncbi:MMPL family transporter [Nocardia sp. NPDC058633]|uniref:MMPL family transporter n=1 Tax=Nocardia sp. NPDC058633 TaxID=3346568 RepID=UPI003647E256